MSLLNKLFKREEIKGYIYDDSIDEKRLTVLKKFCTDNEIALADLTLLDMALTHSSYANERGVETADYERLEFLGDSVIGLSVVEYLYNQYPEMNEGEMTRIKSDVVSQASLSEVARNLGLSRLLNLGKAELLGRGRRKPSILSDVFESVVGAIYLSSTSYQTKDFILRQLIPSIKDIKSCARSEKSLPTPLKKRIIPPEEKLIPHHKKHLKSRQINSNETILINKWRYT